MRRAPAKTATRRTARPADTPAVTETDGLPATVLADLRAGLLPLDLIDPSVYANPRGAIDADSEDFRDFLGSVEAQGVLVPVGIGPKTAAGKYPLVFGWQRHLAATKLKHTGLPIVYRPEVTDKNSARRAGAAENTARRAMRPLAEAETLHAMMTEGGLTQVEAAKALGMSERTARNRLKLRDLPPLVAGAIDDGTIAHDAIPLLTAIGDATPRIAGRLVERISSGDIPRGILADPEMTAEMIWDQIDDIDLPVLSIEPGPTRYFVDLPIVDDERKAKLTKRYHALPEAESGGFRMIRFEASDVEAARSAGVLLELAWPGLGGAPYSTAIIDDVDWLTDRLDVILDRMERTAAKEAEERTRREAAAEQEAAAGRIDGLADTERAGLPRETAAEKKERERKEAAAKQAAEAHAEALRRSVERSRITNREKVAMNAQIGKGLSRRMKPPITLEGVQLVGVTMLRQRGVADLIAGGLALTDTFTEEVDGRQQPTRDVVAIRETLVARMLDASTAEEAFGLLLHLCVAAAACESPDTDSLSTVMCDESLPLASLVGIKQLRAMPDRAVRRFAAFAEAAENRAAHQAALAEWYAEARLCRLLHELTSEDPPQTVLALRSKASQYVHSDTVATQLDPRESTAAIERAAAARLIYVGGHDDDDKRPVKVTDAGRRHLVAAQPRPELAHPTHPDRAKYIEAGVERQPTDTNH